MTPIQGFAPDLDPTTPGVLTDCSMVVPFEGGFKGAPAAVSVGADALAAECRGAAVLSDLSGNRRVIAGTASNLYELSGTTWNSVSKVGGYTLGSDDRWSFIQYANAALAATITTRIQRSTSGAFADIATAPKATIVEAALGFAVAFNTSDTTYGVSQDRWWCSALNDETDWTPAASTQSTTGRLIGGSGPITAAKRFGDDVVAYKNRTMFVGRYTGPPEVWRFTQVSTDVGCVGVSAVADTMIGHIFVGQDNVYIFDGTTPRPLEGSEQLRTWLFRDINPNFLYKTQVVWDRPNYTVSIHYVSTASSGTIDSAVVYHVINKRWGRANRNIEAPLAYVSPQITYDGGSALVTTYNSGPMIPFDSPFWTAGATVSAVFNTSHVLQTLSGATESSSFTTGDIGDEDTYTTCDNIKVRYTQSPTTSVATGYFKDEEGVSVSTGDSESTGDGKHDMRQDARFHRFSVAQTGDWKATAMRAKLIPSGSR